MRAAEILVEMLLDEATVYGIVFGPNIPKEGYWVSGPNIRGMVSKLARGLGAGQNQHTEAYLSALMQNGYAVVTAKDGQAAVYGTQIPRLTPQAADILSITGTTPVTHVTGLDDKTQQRQLTGKLAFRIPLTPQEKEQEKAQRKAAGKPPEPTPEEEQDAQAQAERETNASLSRFQDPEEEAEFKRWAAQHQSQFAPGMRAGGLATLYPEQGEPEDVAEPGGGEYAPPGAATAPSTATMPQKPAGMSNTKWKEELRRRGYR